MKLIIFVLTMLLSELGICETPLPSAHYAYAPKEAALDRGDELDLDNENLLALEYFFSLQKEPRFYIVPGYSDKKNPDDLVLHEITKKRLRMAEKLASRKKGTHFFILSGGNVWPQNTPYNEAMEMKRYLMQDLGVEERRILIEPYARNSITNLRNVGRLLLALGAKRARIVTTWAHRLYFAFPQISSLYIRSWRTLGYVPGKLRLQFNRSVMFRPRSKVFRRGSSALDP